MDIKGLIVGLGNPGKEYENTRHNLGFMLIDELLQRAISSEKISGSKHKYELWKCRFSNKGQDTWLLMKPQTYMNLSGEAVVHAVGYYRIPTEQILVLHDELDLPLGRMRLKIGGGAAGHKGILSIQTLLGSPDFYRLRMGIGKRQNSETIGHVFGRFATEEKEIVDKVLKAASDGVLLFTEDGQTPAQNILNKFNVD